MKAIGAIAAAAGAAMLAGAGAADADSAYSAEELANRDVAVRFYEAALNEKDWDKASVLLDRAFTQHDATGAQGADDLHAHVRLLAERFPRNRGDIRHAYVDGDIVVLHVDSVWEPGARAQSLIDTFRIANGKVAERWALARSQPDDPANDNAAW